MSVAMQLEYVNESPGVRPGQPLRFPVLCWERDAAGNAGMAIAVLGLSPAEVLGLTPDAEGRFACFLLRSVRTRCERVGTGDGCVTLPPAKARRGRCGERPERGGGQGGVERRRVRRVGTRSGYGSPGGGGREFFGGSGGGCVADRTLQRREWLLTGWITGVFQSRLYRRVEPQLSHCSY